jgi:hypothetical protein
VNSSIYYKQYDLREEFIRSGNNGSYQVLLAKLEPTQQCPQLHLPDWCSGHVIPDVPALNSGQIAGSEALRRAVNIGRELGIPRKTVTTIVADKQKYKYVAKLNKSLNVILCISDIPICTKLGMLIS